jgi:hypothetical protein
MRLDFLYWDKLSKQRGSHTTVVLFALKSSLFLNGNRQITKTGKQKGICSFGVSFLGLNQSISNLNNSTESLIIFWWLEIKSNTRSLFCKEIINYFFLPSFCFVFSLIKRWPCSRLNFIWLEFRRWERMHIILLAFSLLPDLVVGSGSYHGVCLMFPFRLHILGTTNFV